MSIFESESDCLPSFETLTSVMSRSDSKIASSCPSSFNFNYFADELLTHKKHKSNDVIKECRNVFLEQYLEKNKVGRRAKCSNKNRTKLNSESSSSQQSTRRLSRRQSCDITASNSQRINKRNSEASIPISCQSNEIDSNNLFSTDLNLSQSFEGSLNEYFDINAELNSLTSFSTNTNLDLGTFTDNEVNELYACFDSCHLSTQFEHKTSENLIDFYNQDVIL
jgi:hypothetical protein